MPNISDIISPQQLSSSSISPISFISTQKVNLQNNKHFIQPSSFLFNIAIDVGMVIFAFIIWKFLWLDLNILQIRDIDSKTGIKNVRIHDFQSAMQGFKCLRKILTNLSNLKSYIQFKCGFQAFTYLFFLRRLVHIMAVLTITDICIWIPYQLYFQSLSQFSLITMPSKGNDVFRTFYTLWVASFVLYGMQDMRNYLRIRLKFRQLRNPKREQILLNSLKQKTVHVHFLGKSQNSQLSQLDIKAKLIQQLNIQARILAVLRIPNYSQQIQMQYKLKIHQIVKRFGVQNMTPIWRLFKAKKNQEAEQDLKKIEDDLRHSFSPDMYKLQIKESKSLDSYFVVLEDINTAQYLCNQFDTQQALLSIIPFFAYRQLESVYQSQNCKVIVKWAQQPNDIMWSNMSPHKINFSTFILFNLFIFLFLLSSFIVVTVSSNQSITDIIFLPKVAIPYVLILFNSLIRLLISKATEWQNKLFQYEVQIKQFKVLVAYFLINVIIGSIVRDTLNLLDVLKTGWGWIELLSLVYQKIDGYFYYLFIFNQTAVAFLAYLVKYGDIILDVFQSKLSYYKLIQIKHKSKYSQNDTFRYGYCYALDFIVIAIILLYSCSNPLIHFFGILYFYTRFYLNGFTFAVFHKAQQCCSNMRMIEQLISMITFMVIIWVFLTATLMVFENTYSNVLILYIFMGGMIYFFFTKHRSNPLEDHIIDEELANTDLTQVIKKWKKAYKYPIDIYQYEKEKEYDFKY